MMKWPTGALCATLLWLAAASGARAQATDAFVLPPGSVRVSAVGEFEAYDALFGGSGRVGLGESLRGPLDAASFPPLAPLFSTLEDFLTLTAGRPGAGTISLSPEDLSLGAVDASVFLSRVRAPMRLDAGLFRRVQLGVTVPLLRGRQQIQRLGIEGATVGTNPAVSRNRDLLARVGGNGAALGALPLLPTRESPAGVELQRRVRAATGDTLILPRGDSARAGVLQRLLVDEYGVEGLRSGASLLRPGDLEVEARVTILDALDGAPLPDSLDGFALRLAAVAGIRVPTGVGPDSVTLFGRDADAGLSGFQIGAIADLFFGSRRWVTVGLRQVVLRGGDVTRRVAPADAPLSVTDPPTPVRWSPGDTLQLRVSPRYRLADPISAGIDYEIQSVTGGRYESLEGGGGAELLATEGGLTQRIGVGVRFSSLPAYARRASSIPIEVTLSWARLLSGPAGMPAASGARLEGSLYLALWGRGAGR